MYCFPHSTHNPLNLTVFRTEQELKTISIKQTNSICANSYKKQRSLKPEAQRSLYILFFEINGQMV